eukprot:m.299968 g.299968  ORF g.299968 m.299968 type:complete len:547 (-) comp55203_c0_seq1:83-1723(-)
MAAVTHLACLLLVACCTWAYGSRAPGDARPNFVFFFPDEMRAESLGTYGHPITQTPNFDALAAAGSKFSQCHTLHTQCSPSRTALATGWYMHILGHRTQTHLLQAYEPNMFRYLRLAGYNVQWFGKNDMLSQDSFNMSVSNWEPLIGAEAGENMFEFGEAGYYSFLNTAGTQFGNDSSTNGDYAAVLQALDFLQDDPPEPFMIFLPGIGSHPSYGAPRDYYDLYDPSQVQAEAPLRAPYPPNKPRYFSETEGIVAYRNLTSLNESIFYKINSIYLGRITYSDWIFGQLMEGLDNLPLAESTTVIVASDHGDFAGDYNLVEKWPGGLDDVLTHVPLIVRTPGGVSNYTVDTPVQLFDIMTTVLDLANISLNHAQFGVSFKPQLLGAPGVANRTVFSEGGFYYPNEIEANDPYFKSQVIDPTNLYYPRYMEELSFYPNGSPRAVMMRNMEYKLVYRPLEVSELYNLTADPREDFNVFGQSEYAQVQASMLMELLQWLVLTSDVTPIQEDSRDLPDPQAAPFACNPWPGVNVLPDDEDGPQTGMYKSPR